MTHRFAEQAKVQALLRDLAACRNMAKLMEQALRAIALGEAHPVEIAQAALKQLNKEYGDESRRPE